MFIPIIAINVCTVAADVYVYMYISMKISG